MERKIVISFILCALFVALPFAVNYADERISSSPAQPPSSPANPVNGVYYVGFATSHEGDDILYVVPGKAYVERAGTLVTVNVTVKFRHAQPCPYSDWKITVENPKNVEVVNETKTELKDAYTAFKQYTVKVLGNGSLDVVFHYGSGCPYGTEERVTVEFYVGTPNDTALNQSTPSPEEVLNTTSINVTGPIKEVDLALRAVVVENYTIEIRGRWTGPNNESLTWRDMLALLKPGERITILASEEDGSLKADVIVINGKTYRKG
ncbi:hypothetical protein [Thermococcus cleftensis]|uniref:hypothetical protein n=1 Tax=Thermococcus cleftensis (strain DSM 27260 / KACC 17922 / CL1) TaxID=163003 RepID=UPI0011D20551|nr:hypothetical protein [Thermococcus cleftensis]